MPAEDGRTAHAPPPMDKPQTSSSSSPEPCDASAGWRRFQAKRPHKKSRAGCLHCKARKVKCDEARPQCRACRMRRETCIYTDVDQPPVSWAEAQVSQVSQVSRASQARLSQARLSQARLSQVSQASPSQASPSQLQFRPPNFDLVDMHLLWYYTVKGYDSFTTGARHADEVSEVLQVGLPRQAFASRFLLDCLLALSAVELQTNGQGPAFGLTARRVLAYRARAIAGYRAALEAETVGSADGDRPDRPDRPAPAALLSCSLLLCALATHMFRDDDARPLRLADWMAVWRGIALVIQLITPRVLAATGVVRLLVRLPVDLDAAARHIPNALLFMVSTLQPGEPDFACAGAYYTTLQFLGSLFQELRAASENLSEAILLRIVTWSSFLPQTFIALAQARRPRALVILAHYLVFLKLCRKPWWVQGIADKEIRDIADVLRGQPPWQTLLQIPLAALETDDVAALIRLLLGDQDCTPDTPDTLPSRGTSGRSDTASPPPPPPDHSFNFALVDSTGHALVFRDRWLQADTGRPAIWKDDPRNSGGTASSSPSTNYDSPEADG